MKPNSEKKFPTKKPLKQWHYRIMGMNWKIFEGVVDLFKNSDDTTSNDREFDSSVLHPPVDRKAKQKILSSC